MSNDTHSQYEVSLISSSSILILSGYLIGFATVTLSGDTVSPFLLICGLLGCLAFVVCDIADRRRWLEALKREQQVTENRLEKHLNTLQHPETLAAVHLARLGLISEQIDAGAL